MEQRKDGASAAGQLREKMHQVEELLQDKENFVKRMKENEMSFTNLCKHVSEAKSRAEKERDELNSQIDELKLKMQSQSALIEQLNEQVGNARRNVRTQKEQLESYLHQQQQLDSEEPEQQQAAA